MRKPYKTGYAEIQDGRAEYDDDIQIKAQELKELGRCDHIDIAEQLKDGANPIELAKKALDIYSIRPSDDILESFSSDAVNILIAEAVNLAAKTHDYTFYELKPAVFVQVAQEGKDAGVFIHHEPNEGTWSLGHSDVGVVNFHDPNNEIKYAIDEIGSENIKFPKNLFEVFLV